ncbi:hypothetical protein OB03_13105 [Brevundimonas sp. GN22]
MTDSVNVSREIVQRLILAADSYGVRYLDSDDMSPEAEELQAATEAAKDALAAAPQAEPVSDPDELALALQDAKDAVAFFDKVKAASEADKTAVGSDHSKWLESAIRRLAAYDYAQTEAPKVEQEPCPERGMGVCDCLQCHPAPASDELLAVVDHQENLLRAICEAPQPKYVVGHLYNAIHNVNCYVARLNAKRAIAKHKGPQS